MKHEPSSGKPSGDKQNPGAFGTTGAPKNLNRQPGKVDKALNPEVDKAIGQYGGVKKMTRYSSGKASKATLPTHQPEVEKPYNC